MCCGTYYLVQSGLFIWSQFESCNDKYRFWRIQFPFSKAVYADEPPYGASQFRELIKCVDGVFAELMGKYNGLKEHHPDYRTLSENTNLKLNECDEAEDGDAKNE